MSAAGTDTSHHRTTAPDRLAFDGGIPRFAAEGPHPWPQFTSGDDLEVLRAAHDAERRHHGDGTTPADRIERRWRAVTGRAEAISCATMSIAVRLVVAGLDLGLRNEVIVPADAATAGLYEQLGLRARPVDLDPQTLHLDPVAVAAAITSDTRAIVAVDRFGTTADFEALTALAARHGIPLIEDATRSLGATYHGWPAGGLGDVSLCQFPCYTTSGAIGHGTLFTTDDQRQASEARRAVLMDTGSQERLDDGGPTPGHDGAGYQPISPLDAAVVLNRIAALDQVAETRSANGSYIRRQLRDVPGLWMPETTPGATHVYSELPFLVVPDELGLPESITSALRDAVSDCLRAEGLTVEPLTPPAIGPGHRSGGAYPVLDTVAAAGFALGRPGAPLDDRGGATAMARIVDCLAKIFVDNVDRIRQLAHERARAA